MAVRINKYIHNQIYNQWQVSNNNKTLNIKIKKMQMHLVDTARHYASGYDTSNVNYKGEQLAYYFNKFHNIKKIINKSRMKEKNIYIQESTSSQSIWSSM